MSIAVIAPGKWDFQDYCCLLTVLETGLGSDWQCLIEPRGGEDFEFTHNSADQSTKVEFQVKGINGPISPKHLCECLLHYPAHSSENPLLQRVASDPTLQAVIVFSGRVEDVLAPLLIGDNWLRGRKGPSGLSRSQRMRVLEAMREHAASMAHNTGLKSKRREHAREYTNSLDEQKLEALLARVMIVEQKTLETVSERCRDRLISDYQTPFGQQTEVIDAMHAVIKRSRDGNEDILPQIAAVISSKSSQNVRPADAVSREEEDEWRGILNQKGALLLTGPPKIGKSYAAKMVAAHYIHDGFQLEKFSSIAAATRYLEAPGSDRRLAILDDPLGGGKNLEAARTALSALENLLKSLGGNRLLVVSQMSGPLLELYKQISVGELKTASFNWIEVRYPEPELALNIWAQSCALHSVEDRLQAFVEQHIRSGEIILEPGCLDFLAAEASAYSGPLTRDRVTQFASRTAAQLAYDLEEKVEGPLMTALALASDFSNAVAAQEIAFVLADAGEQLPSRLEGISFTEYIVGGSVGSKESPAPPAYTEEFGLTHDQYFHLDRLERKHWITNEGGFNFRHPTFRGAAAFLIDGSTEFSRSILKRRLQRALFCARPGTSRTTARNLEWLYYETNDPEAKRLVFETAIEGLKSAYPATSDICFNFLVSLSDDMSSSNELAEYGRKLSSEEISDFHWMHGEPYRSLVRTRGSHDFLNDYKDVPPEHVEASIARLDDFESPLPTVEATVTLLRFFRKNPKLLSPEQALRLLSFDEGVVRAETTAAWLSVPRNGDEEITKRIFGESHPKVAKEALESVLASWLDTSQDRRDRLVSGLCQLAIHPSNSLVMLSVLEIFDRGSTNKSDLAWPLFEKLCPILVSHFPAGISLNNPRLFAIAKSAAQHCGQDGFAKLLSAMLKRVEATIADGSIPNDHAFGVIELILEKLSFECAAKAPLLRRIIKLPGTAIRVVIAAEIAEAWNILSDDEKLCCQSFFDCSEECDGDWLAAAVLTRAEPPAELLELFIGPIGASQFLAAESSSIPSLLSSEQLDACLMLYMGAPQPLWWIGKHHSSTEKWSKVVEIIARQPEHQLFDSAFREIADFRTEDLLSQIIEELAPRNSDQVFELMLDIKRERVGDFFPNAWSTLMRACPNEATFDRWTSSIADAATSTLEDLSDLMDWLPSDAAERVLEKLPSDVTAIQLTSILESFTGSENDELITNTIDLIAQILDVYPPRVHGTLTGLKAALEHTDCAPDALVEKIEIRRLEVIESMHLSVPKREGTLTGWAGPH